MKRKLNEIAQQDENCFSSETMNKKRRSVEVDGDRTPSTNNNIDISAIIKEMVQHEVQSAMKQHSQEVYHSLEQIASEVLSHKKRIEFMGKIMDNISRNGGVIVPNRCGMEMHQR